MGYEILEGKKRKRKSGKLGNVCAIRCFCGL